MTDYHNGHDYLERPLSIWKFEKHVMLAFEFRKNICNKMTRNQYQVIILKKGDHLIGQKNAKKKKFAYLGGT